ncbi:MAG: hypothetical protein GY895_05800 [Phycisphaera sp.]|nr:hypothetical protein [Phycisphaera sp.]
MHRSLTINAPVAIGLFASTTIATADTLTVGASGCQSVSINAAIDAASDGDVIRLAAETYFADEAVDLGGRQITLRGTLDKSGGATTILDGASTHTVLVAESGETTATMLENLVVQDALASMWSVDDVDADDHGFVPRCRRDERPDTSRAAFGPRPATSPSATSGARVAQQGSGR